jgi:predicted ferric reductase
MVQYSGILAIGAMSIAMILALRPRWPETWLGGLDKMYRLHKWLGIAALTVAVVHWLWTQAPGWAASLGLLELGQRPPRPPLENPVEQALANLRGTAEGLGEWAFYAAVVLIVLALIPRFPYRWFFKTHRLLAVAYLVLVFHTIVLTKFGYWASPLGVAMAALLIYGAAAAFIVLLRQVGAGRKVDGTVTHLHYYPSLRVLEGEVELAPGWPGHKAGQFAFVTSDRSEGAHPFTIASAWNEAEPRLIFIAKELGDFTSQLRETVKPGQKVKVEGPYGRFTFEDDCSRQIWVGGGIGITPFIGRMKQLARERRSAPDRPPAQIIDLFHTTAVWSV